jgi:hypothetical protein
MEVTWIKQGSERLSIPSKIMKTLSLGGRFLYPNVLGKQCPYSEL